MRFQLSDQGDVEKLYIPFEPNVKDIVYRRKLDQPSKALLESLVGIYETDVKGLNYTVTLKDGTLFAMEAGYNAEACELYKASEDVLGFTIDRVRLDFMLEEHVERLIVKMPYTTLEAIKQ